LISDYKKNECSFSKFNDTNKVIDFLGEHIKNVDYYEYILNVLFEIVGNSVEDVESDCAVDVLILDNTIYLSIIYIEEKGLTDQQIKQIVDKNFNKITSFEQTKQCADIMLENVHIVMCNSLDEPKGFNVDGIGTNFFNFTFKERCI